MRKSDRQIRFDIAAGSIINIDRAYLTYIEWLQDCRINSARKYNQRLRAMFDINSKQRFIPTSEPE